MSVYYANCHTRDNNDLDRRIQGLGGHTWGWLNTDTIIYMIDTLGHTFYTQPPSGPGKQIVTRTHANGRKYLTTLGDGLAPNNILSLPVCR